MNDTGPASADRSIAQVTGDIAYEVCSVLEQRPSKWWWLAFAGAVSALAVGVFCIIRTFWLGLGVWGLNSTVGWGVDITNFVFWIGVGHAGTLISAILLLFRARWRTAINRAAEAMTIFAVICAGSDVIVHMGRPWLAFWVLPYPNTRGSLWVNFNSPLVWDVFAVSTYFTVSLVFWYVGLLPDLATVRDRAAAGIRKKIFEVLSLGWDGSNRTWSRYETVYLLLAGLSTALVISVHSVVSMDFATSVLPGWHATIFPPYCVSGAVFSGFAMVLTLMIIVRATMNWRHIITADHLENMAKIMILTGGIVMLAYATEIFTAWYSGPGYEWFAFRNRMTGPYAWAYWTMVSCIVLGGQLLWIKRLRTSAVALFILSLVVNVGMWFERFVIIVTSLHRDFLPSNWTMYWPTWVEYGITIGWFGLFLTLFLLFSRTLPMISIGEVKTGLALARAKRVHSYEPSEALAPNRLQPEAAGPEEGV